LPILRHLAVIAAVQAVLVLATAQQQPQQPQQCQISTRTVPVLTADGLRFRDLNRNGHLDPFEDWRLPPSTRAADLVPRLSLAQKAGLMVHGTAPSNLPGPMGAIGTGKAYDLEAAGNLIRARSIPTLITRLDAAPADFAEQNNHLQEIAEQTPFAIPLTISTDPRNSFDAVLGAGTTAGQFSRWPGPLGLAAAGDPALTRQFGDVARRECLAVGITEALSPQADLATEPRWPRIDGTFGEDATLATAMVQAYVEGFQNGPDGLHSGSVVTVVKHWAGYGSAKDGWDSHNIYGRYATFPSGNFAYHLKPFAGAFAAHVAAVMPTYSILLGAPDQAHPYEPVGGGYNKRLLTGLLRDTYGFRGVILTDWLITDDCKDTCISGAPAGQAPTIVPGRYGMSWGVQNLSVPDRYAKAIDAGVDQFGGVDQPDILVKLVQQGRVREQRLNESAARILQQTFALGLFEHPFIDAQAAAGVVGSPAFLQQALQAQHRSMVLLEDKKTLLPLKAPGPGTVRRVFLYGVDTAVAARYDLTPVPSVAEADLAILRMHAPYQPLHPGYFFGSRQHEGDLDFKDDDEQFRAFQQAAGKVPTIVAISLDRPAVLSQLTSSAGAILANFGASDEAILDVITGRAKPEGKLPFELPSSMDAVRGQMPDRPHDSSTPLFPFGFGLSYP
jgi:beta-glucosidase